VMNGNDAYRGFFEKGSGLLIHICLRCNVALPNIDYGISPYLSHIAAKLSPCPCFPQFPTIISLYLHPILTAYMASVYLSALNVCTYLPTYLLIDPSIRERKPIMNERRNVGTSSTIPSHGLIFNSIQLLSNPI